MPDITIHGPTSSGSYNVLGLANGMFFLQGNLTLAQLKELHAATRPAALKALKGD